MIIKGTSVVLHEVVGSTKDKLNNDIPVFDISTVEDVLVNPTTAAAAGVETELDRQKNVYELCIPLGDTHKWEGGQVEIFGQTYRVAAVNHGVNPDMLPPMCRWNKKVVAIRYE